MGDITFSNPLNSSGLRAYEIVCHKLAAEIVTSSQEKSSTTILSDFNFKAVVTISGDSNCKTVPALSVVLTTDPLVVHVSGANLMFLLSIYSGNITIPVQPMDSTNVIMPRPNYAGEIDHILKKFRAPEITAEPITPLPQMFAFL